MVNLANGLAADGLEVDLVAVSPGGPYRNQLDGRVRVVDLNQRRMLAATLPLARYLRRARPPALLTALDYINVAAMLARAIARVPVRIVVSTHKYFSVATDESPLWRERHLLPAAMRLTYGRADAVVAIAEAMADDLAKTIGIDRARISVVPNPAVTDDLLRRAREPVAHPWLQDDGPPVVLGVGRLHPQKDFPNLIEAFAHLRATRPARLIILGEGEERGALEALIAQRDLGAEIDLAGFVPNPYAFMARAALFVLSSRYEGLPTVLIEALACGCPVVSTDCPSGPAEILDGGRLGPLVPMGNPLALAEAMAATLDQPPPRGEREARAADYRTGPVVARYRALLGV